MAAYSATDLANINALIAGGVSQAMIAGEMVQYRALPELMKIKRMIEADLASASAGASFLPMRYPETDRGV